MIGNFGMGTKLEVFYNDEMDNGTPFLGRSLSSGGGNSESTRFEFDTEVLALVNEAYTMAKNHLMQHKVNHELRDRILKLEYHNYKQNIYQCSI